jgi:hypothetical protein
VEIGYLLTAADLALPDEMLDQPAYIQKSSVRAIADRDPSRPFSSLVRGERSLGALLIEAGYPAVPSPVMRYPEGGYLTGGYSTARHGSRDGGRISGVQLELHYGGVRDTAENRRAFAEALVDALLAYAEEWMGLELPTVRP